MSQDKSMTNWQWHKLHGIGLTLWDMGPTGWQLSAGSPALPKDLPGFHSLSHQCLWCSMLCMQVFRALQQFVTRCLYGDGMFCKCFFFSNRFRQHLWTDLYNTLTRHVLVGNGTLQGDFLGIGPQKIWAPKLPTRYFQQLRNSMATLRANSSGENKI